jgi:hypothetical protein
MSDFDGAGVKPGVQVWRIEKMVPTPVPPETYGQARLAPRARNPREAADLRCP